MGSFDFNASDGFAAIFGPINESAVVHMSKFKKVNHVCDQFRGRESKEESRTDSEM